MSCSIRGKRVFIFRPRPFAVPGLGGIALMCLMLCTRGNGELSQENKPQNKAPPSRLLSDSGESKLLDNIVVPGKQLPKEINQQLVVSSDNTESPIMSNIIPPHFITEPEDHFAYKNSPAKLTCTVSGATEVAVRCNNRRPNPSMVYMYENQEINEDNGGRRYVIVTITISRNEVESFFSPEPYWCQCIAHGRSKSSQVKSRKAFVKIAYLRRIFNMEPVGGHVTLGQEYKLHCRPPNGIPAPTVEWMKDDVLLNSPLDPNYVITQDGDLIIRTTSIRDSGNYSCLAKNVAAKRKSPPAHVQVGVDGGWSEWSAWSGCPTECGVGEERRLRTCTEPRPQNGGAVCPGSSVQTRACTNVCPVDGGWTDWSNWATCSPECVHRRRRTCSRPIPHNSGLTCPGPDIETRNCSGGLCTETRNPVPLSENPNLVLYSCLFVALGLLLMVVVATLVFMRRKRGFGGSFSHSTSPSYASGRTTSSYPISAVGGHVRDDFCIIPTKPGSGNSGKKPFAYPPAYSDHAYQISKPMNSSGKTPSQLGYTVVYGGQPWQASSPPSVCVGQDLNPQSLSSRDDASLARASPGCGGLAYQGYCERSSAPPNDGLESERFAIGPQQNPSSSVEVKGEIMRINPEYDSGFEGEPHFNFLQQGAVLSLGKTQNFEEKKSTNKWASSSNASSDAGYSGSCQIINVSDDVAVKRACPEIAEADTFRSVAS